MFTSHQIPIRRLDRSRAHSFSYLPTGARLTQMADSLDWREIEIKNFSGVLNPTDDGFELTAHIEGRICQSCVISGAPVHNKVSLDIRRHYQRRETELPAEMFIEESFDLDQEVMPQNLELDDLLSESLVLFAPEYPKIREYQGDAPFAYQTEQGEGDDVEEKRNPFAVLEALKGRKNDENS